MSKSLVLLHAIPFLSTHCECMSHRSCFRSWSWPDKDIPQRLSGTHDSFINMFTNSGDPDLDFMKVIGPKSNNDRNITASPSKGRSSLIKMEPQTDGSYPCIIYFIRYYTQIIVSPTLNVFINFTDQVKLLTQEEHQRNCRKYWKWFPQL